MNWSKHFTLKGGIFCYVTCKIVIIILNYTDNILIYREIYIYTHQVGVGGPDGLRLNIDSTKYNCFDNSGFSQVVNVLFKFISRLLARNRPIRLFNSLNEFPQSWV